MAEALTIGPATLEGLSLRIERERRDRTPVLFDDAAFQRFCGYTSMLSHDDPFIPPELRQARSALIEALRSTIAEFATGSPRVLTREGIDTKTQAITRQLSISRAMAMGFRAVILWAVNKTALHEKIEDTEPPRPPEKVKEKQRRPTRT